MNLVTLLLAATLLGSNTAAAAPNPCKGAKTSTDAYTGQEKLVISTGPKFSVIEEGGKTRLVYLVRMGGLIDSTLPVGHQVGFRTEDGGEVTLRLTAETPPKITAYNGGASTSWRLVYGVEEADIRAMAKSPVVAVRKDMGDGDGPYTVELPKGERKKMLAAFQCIESRL